MQDPKKKKLIAFLKELKALCDEHDMQIEAGDPHYLELGNSANWTEIQHSRELAEAIAQLEARDA